MIFTKIYWRFQFKAIFSGQPPLNIVEVFEIDIPDDEPEHG